ncbi:hypothetical protein B566_EDAN009258 [Ephemera danica]|nr:hypothetical protein B566_EDAN009258 [Ephemera danica]
MSEAKYPQKRHYRQRAHSNPTADHVVGYPVSPDQMDWSKLYPQHFPKEQMSGKQVEFADIGCGYGGLLVKVSQFVIERIQSLRASNPGQYQNIACLRTNAMKFLPNFFDKAQLKKMFFLFPDPHFKDAKHEWRIINRNLLAEYAYLLQEGGLAYTVTDVPDLHDWMVRCFDKHPLFERVSDQENNEDPVVEKLWDSSEEGKKVTRNNGPKLLAVYRRISDPYMQDITK